MKWTSLAAWHDLEARLKTRLDEWTRHPFPGMPKVGGDAWLTRQVALALAPAFLLTPIATWILYPWLPQPEAWLYEATGVMLLGVSFVAHTEYKRAQLHAALLSAAPGAGALLPASFPAGLMASSTEANGRHASHGKARFEINLRGKEHVLETNLDLLKTRTLSHRRASEIVWDFTGVRAVLDEDSAEAIVTDTLSVMDLERRWRIIEAQLEDLERVGYLARKRR